MPYSYMLISNVVIITENRVVSYLINLGCYIFKKNMIEKSK